MFLILFSAAVAEAVALLKTLLLSRERVCLAASKSYSDETWSAFKTAYENALNAPENADADTLNELAKELSDAQKALTRIGSIAVSD